MKQIFILCQQKTCLCVANRLCYKLPTAATILIKKHIEIVKRYRDELTTLVFAFYT